MTAGPGVWKVPMHIRGVLESGSLRDFLQWVKRLPGPVQLMFSPGFLETRLVFDVQRVLHLESTAPRGILGQFLVRQRYLTPEQLQEARTIQRSTGDFLIHIILRRRWLSPEELEGALRDRVVDLLLSYRMIPDVTFDVRPIGTEAEEREVPAWRGVAVDAILEQLDRREPRWQAYLDAYPAMSRTVFKMVEGNDPKSDESIDPLIYQVYRVVDGRRSILEIAQMLGELEFDVLRAAAELHQRGVIVPAGEQIPEIIGVQSEPDVDEMIETVLDKLRRGDIEGAANLLNYLEKLYSGFAEKMEHLRQLVSQKLRDHYMKIYPPGAIPRLNVSVEELERYHLDPMLGFMLSRIDGRQPIEVLQNLIPVHEGRFYQMLKTLVDLGLVTIESG